MHFSWWIVVKFYLKYFFNLEFYTCSYILFYAYCMQIDCMQMQSIKNKNLVLNKHISQFQINNSYFCKYCKGNILKYFKTFVKIFRILI